MDQMYASVDPSRKLPTSPMSVCSCDADLLQTICCQGAIDGAFVFVIQGGFFFPFYLTEIQQQQFCLFQTKALNLD